MLVVRPSDSFFPAISIIEETRVAVHQKAWRASLRLDGRKRPRSGVLCVIGYFASHCLDDRSTPRFSLTCVCLGHNIPP